MDLAVIIPARNEEAHIGEQLDALEAQEWDGDWEVIVVDNGSTDRTEVVVHQHAKTWPRLRLLRANDRPDKSYAAGEGVAATSARAFAFTDADDVVADGWLAAIGEQLRHHPIANGALELDLLNPLWMAGSRGRSVESADTWFEGLFPSIRGNNFGVQRDVWERVGPLPAALHPVEDLAFALEAHRAGVLVAAAPNAIVHYRYRNDIKSLWRQGFAYGNGRTRIVRMLRDAGESQPSRFAGWRSWVWLIINSPRLVTRPGRARWVWVAANRLGQLVGSVSNRVVYL